MIVTNSAAVSLMSISTSTMSMSRRLKITVTKLFLSVILLLSLTQGCTATIATTNKTKQQQQQQQQQQQEQQQQQQQKQKQKQKQNDKNSNTATNTDSTSGWEQENDRSISSASTTTTTPAKNGRWALIHIGPSLTGTSAIQASIAIVEKTLLQQDKFEDAVYHATNNHYRHQTNRLVRRFQQHHQQHEQQRLVEGPIGIQNIVGCFRPDAVEYNTTSINTTSQDVVVAFDTLSPQQQQQQRRMAELSCHPDSLNLLKEVSTVRNHNLLLSSDYLADPRTDIDALYKFIQSHWENHKVVAYYRRYYDWLLSLYDRMHRYENENNPETRIPISDFIEQEYETQALFKTLYVTKAIERYRVYFPYNEIINMYEMDDVRIGFYCKALIGGTITGACEQFKKYYNSNTKKEQESVNYYHHESKRTAENRANYVYNDLVYYAKKRGLIPSSSSTIRTTEEAIAAAKYYQEQTNGKTSIDFHYSTIICPRSKQANWILSKSKEVEEELFPGYYKRKGQNEIEEHYEHIKKTYHLCHIDADAVLDLQPEWVLFFQQMNNNTTTTTNNNSNLPVTVTSSSSSSEKQSNPKKHFLKRNTKQTGIEFQ